MRRPGSETSVGSSPLTSVVLTDWLSMHIALGVGFAGFLGTDLDPKCIEELGPRTVIAPLGEVLEHGALGKEIVGEHFPLAAGAVEVQDLVDNLSHFHRPRPTAMLAWRNQRLQNGASSQNGDRHLAAARFEGDSRTPARSQSPF